MAFDNAGSTIMSVLFGVADQDDRRRQYYLERFAIQYSQPLVDYFCKSKKQSEAEALDLVQDFWLHKLVQPPASENLVAKYLQAQHQFASQGEQSFRRYLLRSISNHLLDALRRKRKSVSLDELGSFEVVSDADYHAFDTVWANRLLHTVVTRVRDECHHNGQLAMWKLFLKQLVLPRLFDTSPPGYAELAAEMGFRDARSAGNAVRTVIRKFHSHMKHCIGDYLPVSSLSASESGISEEFHEIMALLSRPGALDPTMFDDFIADCGAGASLRRDPASSNKMPPSAPSFFSGPEQTLYLTDADIGFRWQQFRESPITTWLESLGVVVDGSCKASFVDLARGAFFDEKLVAAIRNGAKQAAREPEDEPVVILGLIYLLAIATGFKHHRRIFSSDPVAKIQGRMSQLLPFAWLDDESKATLRQFIDADISD